MSGRNRFLPAETQPCCKRTCLLVGVRCRWRCCIQTGPLVAVDDERMHASVLAQSYNHQATRDYANPHRPDVRRRPDAESYRVYAQPDAAPPGSSVDQLAEDARGYSGTQRAGPVAYPYTRSDQPAPKAADHEVASMRCETCSRPAMFVCSACKKAPYCSVDCQVCHNDS